VWYLTPEGENALKLGDVGLLKSAGQAYHRWKLENQKIPEKEDDKDTEDQRQVQEATIDEVEQVAIEGLKRQIATKNGYEFQDLVAALLRGMGYSLLLLFHEVKTGELMSLPTAIH
jgi:restriction system protein